MKIWGKSYATGMGMLSIVIWASLVAWVKLMSESLSAV